MITVTLTNEDAQAYLDKEETIPITKFNEAVKQYNNLINKYVGLEKENQELRSKLQGMETLLKAKVAVPEKRTFDKPTVSSTGNLKAKEARELQSVDYPLKLGVEALQRETKPKKLNWTSNSKQAISDRKLVDYAYNSPNKSERNLERLHNKMPHRSVRSIMDYCYRTYPDIKFKNGYMIRK